MTIIMIAINLLSPERQLLMCSISASSRRIKGPCNAGALFNSKSVLDLVYGSCAAIGFDSKIEFQNEHSVYCVLFDDLKGFVI